MVLKIFWDNLHLIVKLGVSGVRWWTMISQAANGAFQAGNIIIVQNIIIAF